MSQDVQCALDVYSEFRKTELNFIVDHVHVDFVVDIRKVVALTEAQSGYVHAILIARLRTASSCRRIQMGVELVQNIP